MSRVTYLLEVTDMYQALYRKWRPKTFDDVVGQEHITETLKKQVMNDRLSHAYLFIGHSESLFGMKTNFEFIKTEWACFYGKNVNK